MNKNSTKCEKRIKRKDQSFMQGTVILTGSLLLVKIMGILFRIFVTGMIGPTGATYFTVAYEIYNPLFALATAGLPIAISRMVSESVANGRYRDVKKIKKISSPIFLLTGTVGLLLMILGAFIIPRLPFVNVPGAFYSVITLAPTIFFACLMSIYRGYYQGLKNMTPTATSEVIEASFKFFIGYVTSYGIIRFGMREYLTNGTFLGKAYATKELAEAAIMPLASAGAILGISLGAAAGFLYLILQDKIRGDGITKNEIMHSPEAKSGKSIAKTLIKNALPIGLGAIIMNVAGLIDTTLILHRIQYVMSTTPNELLAQYGPKIGESVVRSKDGVHGFLMGCYSFTLPLMMLVPAITQAFGIVALPSVTRAWTLKDSEKLKKSMETVIRMTMLVTIPAGIGLSVIGPELLSVIYRSRPIAVSIASEIIPILGIATIFTAASTPICSMLQAIGRVDLPVKIISIGLAIKILVNYILVGVPQINIQGAGIGTLAGYAFILVTSMYMLFKNTKVVPSFVDTVLKPLVGSLFCGAAAKILMILLKDRVPVIIAIALSIIFAVVVYLLALVSLGELSRNDIKLLPKGEKIIKILEKLRFIS